jgi:hypothetical protein
MTKRIITALIIFVMLFASVPAFAEDGLGCSNPVTESAEGGSSLIKETLTVSSDREVFEVGFVTLRFPKEFIDSESLPVAVTVSIYYEDGQSWIEFSPEIGEFEHKVQVKVKGYNGLLYDVTTGQDVIVNIGNQVLMLSHFSRYAFS